jgi:hypothetical protein
MRNLAALQEELTQNTMRFARNGPMNDDYWEKDRENKAEREKILDEIRKCERGIHEAKSTMPYSEGIAVEICNRISSGQLLIDICLEERMPYPQVVMEWLSDQRHADFAQLYRQAKNHRLDHFEESIIRISDDCSRDIASSGKANGNAVARAKIMIDTRLRHLRAYRSDRWSESMTVKNVDANEFDLSKLDDAELERRLAELDLKNSIVGRDIGSGIGDVRDNVTQLSKRRAGTDLF